MSDNIKRGNEGEDLAKSFLEKKGFRVLCHHYRYKRSEIDLIVSRENWLVYVEVKTRTSTAFGFPEDFVDQKKKKKIFEGALQHMIETDWDGNVRFDIVAVDLSGTVPSIHHIEDAFY